MAENTYLNRRPDGIYAVRLRVPDDLRSHPAMQGRKERWEELPTRSLNEANRLKLPIVARIKAEFDQLRRAIANAPTPTGDDLKWMAQDAYLAELAEDSSARANNFAKVAEFNSIFGPAYLEETKRQLAVQEFALVTDDVERKFRELGFNPDPNSATFKQACEHRLRTLVEVQMRKDERDRRDFDGTPRDSLFRESAKFTNPESRKPLSELLPLFHRERTGMAQATMDAQRDVIESLEDFFGHKKPVAAITRRDMLQFKNVLLETPSSRSKRFPGATIYESVRRNKALDKPFPPLDEKTINGRYLAHVKPLLGWCVDQGFIDSNPADKVKAGSGQKKRKEKRRHGFSRAELEAIFGSDTFATNAPRDAKFWAVLIAAYQGLRVSEIGQLEVSDIAEQRGIPCLHVRYWSDDEGDGKVLKSLKTAAARYVPIHPELIKLGLLDYAAQMRKAHQRRMFPDWEPNKYGNFANSVVPRWFNGTFLESLGIKRRELSFHSFRHTFKTAAALADVATDRHDHFTGHAAEGVGATYRDGPPASYAALAADLAKLRFEGVDLSHLYPIRSIEAKRAA